ncbi:MAG: carbohydrate-binding protein [Bacteroidetes bacterium]|nr:MAG: carbohydrate-binding protein [Bacteroidota bacterium]
MKTLKSLKLILTSLLLIFFFGCNNDSKSELDSLSKISISLTDAPGDFDNVFIQIVDIMIKYNDDSDEDNGWQSIADIDQTVDLLELTGGESILLVDAFELPPGMLNQIRLVLGDENTIVIDGETFPLSTPSAQQSGLKLKVDHELEPGFTYNILLDFDVDKSIVIAGNSGNINLKPVIRASTLYASGKIQGTVNPFDFQVMASVIVDGETISAYADDSGVFVLNGVPAGTYDVLITPDPTSNYAETTVTGVEVVNGEVTDIGIIELQLIPGSITGTITNENDGLVVTASIMVDGEEVSANINDERVFLLENIPVGIYTVTLTPNDGFGLSPKTIENVEVTTGAITDLGDITLD